MRELTPSRTLSAETPSFDPEVHLSPDDCINWRDLFSNDAPVLVDVGCGKGRFLIETAQANPGINYLGIEKAGRPFYACKERVAKRRIPNVRIVRADAHYVVGRQIPTDSVAGYFVLFPDPWPKKRHHKRRIFTPQFVDDIARTLQPDGFLQIATDIADYSDEIALMIEANPAVRLIEEGTYTAGAFLTNFAAKYLQQGRTLYQARYRVE